MVQMIPYAKQKEAQRYRTHGYQRGKEGETNWEIRIDVYTLLYVK